MTILIRPLITEKAINATTVGKYIFRVAVDATKHSIAKEIKEIYKVDAIKVNIIKSKAQTKITRGKYQSTSKIIKKAIVTLKKGQKIEGFEVKE